MANGADNAGISGAHPAGVLACVQGRVARFFDLVDQLQGDDEVELIHDVRVASRRLSEGLVVLARAGGDERVARLREWLREARSLLGPTRDADVMRQVLVDLFGGKKKRLGIPAAVAFNEAMLRERRYWLTEARLQLGPAMIAERRDELGAILRDASSSAAHCKTDGGAECDLESVLCSILLDRTGCRRKAFRKRAGKAAKTGRPARLHAARIAGKKIRYALELAHEAGLLDATREIKAFRRLQDRLGAMNDLAVLHARLEEFGDEAIGRELEGADRLLGRVKRQRRRMVKEFISLWPEVERRLKKVRAAALARGARGEVRSEKREV